jgi:hypothetical protein
MQLKWAILAVGVGALAALQISNQKAAADPALATQASIGGDAFMAKVKHGFGSLGCKMIGNVVRKMSVGTNEELKTIKTGLKKAQGRDGQAARDAAKTAVELDKTALTALKDGKPVLAMNSAMKAKDFVSVAKRILETP